jgi:hypothetical protein
LTVGTHSGSDAEPTKEAIISEKAAEFLIFNSSTDIRQMGAGRTDTLSLSDVFNKANSLRRSVDGAGRSAPPTMRVSGC